MSNDLQVFNFNSAEVRTVVRDGEPWWVAKDVTDVLGLVAGKTSVQQLDADEVHTMPLTDAAGRQQDMTVINESGLYSLILRSRRKEAKAFKKWVTAEVLPAIRKVGAYAAPGREPLTEVDKLAAMMTQFVPSISGRISAVDERLTQVEERQRVTDPREIEQRMFQLHKFKQQLVEGTKSSQQPVTHPGFWRALKEHCGIASFQNRAALDVPLMEKALAFARNWCFSRGVQPPTLFDGSAAQEGRTA